MKPIERVLERLEGIEQRSGGFMALCPSHDDHTPSLSVSEGDGDKVLIRCFAGCATGDVLDALGLSIHDLFERGERNNGCRNVGRKPSASWQVKDATGELQAVHVRFDKPDGDKDCLWRLPGSGWGLKGRKLSTLPLYRSEDIGTWSAGASVVVVEGEKAADALASIYPSVLGTVTGASHIPSREVLEVLHGRSVILWSDADDEGRRHMRRIAEALQGIAREVRIFEWSEAPKKGDAADHPAVLARSRQSIRELLKGWSEAPIWEVGSSSSSSLTYTENDDDDVGLGLQWFSEMGEPRPREFLVEDLLPKGYPATIYGTGGVAKSMLALLMGIGYAGGIGCWLGLRVNGEGPVLYLDFELDADDQLRRVRDLCAGLSVKIPDKLGYLSALGKGSGVVFEAALELCRRHDVQLLVIDSLGPAMIGDAERARDVIAFHNEFIEPFRALGVTVLIVDHQGKLQSGESYQGKTALGSAYKSHLVRSGIQVEAIRRGKEAGTLTVRLRQNKTNFGTQRDPFDVLLTFGHGSITAEPVEVDATELAGEATLNADDRVLLALDAGAAFPDELAERTGLAIGTVKNCLTRLRQRGDVENTDQVKGRAHQVTLSSSSSFSYKGSDDDDAEARAAREDEELLSTGRIQSDRQVFELAREHSRNDHHPEWEDPA